MKYLQQFTASRLAAATRAASIECGFDGYRHYRHYVQVAGDRNGLAHHGNGRFTTINASLGKRGAVVVEYFDWTEWGR